VGILTGFSVDEFRSSFGKEPQRTSQFAVLCIPPTSIIAAIAASAISSAVTGLVSGAGGGGGMASELRDFRLRCTAINQPGKNISTFQYNPTVGNPINIANGSSYDQIQLEIIASQTGLERQLMQAWIEFINPTMIYNTNVRYFDNYTGTLLLNTYKSDGDISQVVRIGNAFPVAISSIEYNWRDNNQTATFRVAFMCESVQVVAPHELPAGTFDLKPIPEVDIGSLLLSGAQALRNIVT